MTNKTNVAIALAGLLALGLTAPAFAAGASETQEQTALMHSKLTLTDAIAAAEHATGGKAFDAGVDADHGKTQVVVETNGPKGVQSVTVDGQTGKVLRVAQGGQAD